MEYCISKIDDGWMNSVLVRMSVFVALLLKSASMNSSNFSGRIRTFSDVVVFLSSWMVWSAAPVLNCSMRKTSLSSSMVNASVSRYV